MERGRCIYLARELALCFCCTTRCVSPLYSLFALYECLYELQGGSATQRGQTVGKCEGARRNLRASEGGGQRAGWRRSGETYNGPSDATRSCDAWVREEEVFATAPEHRTRLRSRIVISKGP